MPCAVSASRNAVTTPYPASATTGAGGSPARCSAATCSRASSHFVRNGTVPDLKKLIANDPKAHPPDKYKVLEDVLEWATNVGYPGYSNAAIDEIFQTWVINVMFAKAAAGKATPEEAIKEAEAASKRIFEKWKAKGLV